ncbi:MAG: hypothetical protein JSV66_03335 [Trueperaceae bacterium]|nr:MAG: hypothetical protein JSV66_03335 [Trueperaceae bacterium]
MIVVRDIFQLHFGKAQEAIALFKEFRTVLREDGFQIERILTDVTGTYYTVVVESRYPSLSAYETSRSGRNPEKWQETYSRIVPLVREGRREIFQEVA